MGLSIPRRRLLRSATSLHPQSQYQFLPSRITCPIHLRHISFNPFKRRRRELLDPSKLKFPKSSPDRPTQPLKPGDLAPNSIFDSSTPPPKPSPKTSVKPSQRSPTQHGRARRLKSSPPGPRLPSPTEGRDAKVMAAALDPYPLTRRRWQRKMVIRNIRRRGRLTENEKILRTERKHMSRSPLIKTGVKKLYPLARQIAGKPLTEAMVQMRFSKKKAAREVLKHLEYARDQAVVIKGMGLGAVGDKSGAKGKDKGNGKGKGKEKEELVVEDKKGKKRVVTDRSAMYVDEAWVGKGRSHERELSFRAKSIVHTLELPYTSISVVLKEEATRIRQAKERELKRQRKRVWVPLPDRPVTAQRQYPLW